MLRAVGMTDEDWDKPQIGIASSWNEITPCNMTLSQAGRARQDRRACQAGGYPARVRHDHRLDGISMGHEGMRASLCQPRGDHRLGRDGDASPSGSTGSSAWPAATSRSRAC
jgi:dihydroxyacid dehydratase/phosphogluconate dehydratase